MTTDARRVLVIPAAGRGSRLGSPMPKALTPVNGRPMLTWLADLYSPWVGRLVVVVQPGFADAFAALARSFPCPVTLAEQPEPTGMLDAVLIGTAAAAESHPGRYWVTWSDQLAIQPATLVRLAAAEPGTAMVLPVVPQKDPYIHFDRDPGGRIVGVRQRREGDVMPLVGESDMGLFSLSFDAASDALPRYARMAAAAAGTGERNFLPFIPWLASRAVVATCPATDSREAVGINTPEELAQVAEYLRSR